MRPSAIKRLIKSINKNAKTNCWEFNSNNDKYGYGRIRDGSKVKLAHRISWEFFIGPLSSDQLLCHKCDNPKCVNPDHLFIGSHLDNTQDAVNKGRIGKLTNDQVHEIKELLNLGRVGRHIAKEYGISPALVSYIKNGHRRNLKNSLINAS